MTDEHLMPIHHVAVPRICDGCYRQMLRLFLDSPTLRIAAQFCPHHDTLAYAQAETVKGKRGIVRWQLQGPIPQSMAVDAIKEMGAEYGVEFSQLEGERTH